MSRHGYLTLDRATNRYTISLGFVGRTRATPAIEVLRQRARRHLTGSPQRSARRRS